MQNDQMIGQDETKLCESAPTVEKPQQQIECQQPITSCLQSEMQQQQAGWMGYQMPMMPMPFFNNQFYGQQQMKANYGDFYVRKSKEEQQLQNQQYCQMFDPNYFGQQQQGFMPMLPMMPFFPPNFNMNYNEQQEEVEQQQQVDNEGKKDEKGRYNRYQKYQKKQYRPKQGRNYQHQQYQQQQEKQVEQQRAKPQRQQFQLQQQQQQQQQIRIDPDSFPALPEQKFVYQKKGVQEQKSEKKRSFEEAKIFYTSNQIKQIFGELKEAGLIEIHENLSKLDRNDVPIILKEGCMQLEIVEPTKISKRIEEKAEIYYEKEKSRRKNTYDNAKVMSRHKFSLQITTYEKKEVK